MENTYVQCACGNLKVLLMHYQEYMYQGFIHMPHLKRVCSPPPPPPPRSILNVVASIDQFINNLIRRKLISVLKIYMH